MKHESFSMKVKKEAAKHSAAAQCCAVAACYGAALFAKYFDARGVVLHTEQEFIAQWALNIFAQVGVKGQVTKRGNTNSLLLVPTEGGDKPTNYSLTSAHAKRGGFEFAVKNEYEIEKLLALFSHNGDETTVRINTSNINCEGCFAAFVTAAFLCSGVVVNPEKGYQLEFITPRYMLMKDFEALLAQHGFVGRCVQRKGLNVLYFKASEQVEDLITLMGATAASLEIMNLKVYKDIRNRANRVTNCETANIDKMVAANSAVIAAIDKLEGCGVLETLPKPLQYAAQLRKANPEFSLAELVKVSAEPVSKSGLSHRYKKICERAKSS